MKFTKIDLDALKIEEIESFSGNISVYSHRDEWSEDSVIRFTVVFYTKNKDIHLGLGRIHSTGRRKVAERLIASSSVLSCVGAINVSIDNEAVLVSVIHQQNNCYHFHLS